MRKHGGTASRRDKHVTLAAISPPGVARGRFVGGQQSGLAGCKPPSLFTRGASSYSSQGRRQGEPWGASPRPSAPTYLPTLCHCEGRLSSGALPPPAACPLGGLLGSATHVLWCGCAGVGAQHCPFGLHALPGATCRGGGGRLPRGGWPSTVVRGFWCQALSLPRPPIPWGGQPGLRDLCLPGAVGVGVGTQHRPCTVRSCQLSLRAVGMAGGRTQGGCLAPLWGASEFGRPPSPGCPSAGRAVGVRHPPAVGTGARAWGPGTVPLACMPCGGLHAAGVGGGPSQGRWPSTVVRRVWCQALSLPRPPVSWGGQPGLRDPCFPGAVVVGVGTQHAPATQRALLRAVVARCGSGGRAPPGGVPCAVVRGC